MPDAAAIFLGKGRGPLEPLLSRANRHGLIAGATGTGKTVTPRVMAEGFAATGQTMTDMVVKSVVRNVAGQIGRQIGASIVRGRPRIHFEAMMRLLQFLFALVVMAPGAADAASPLGRVTATAATSACIGNGSSPVCAAETLLACFARADAGLCKRVGVSEPGAEIAAGPHTVEYIVDRQTTIKPQDITDDLRDLDYFKPGYVLLEIRRRDCPPGQTNCEDVAWSDLQVYARPIPTGGWDIAAWRGDSEPESAPEIPENYQPPLKPN